jgi:hypothetical protein
MKFISLVAVFLFSFLCSNAQLKSTSTSIKSYVEKVVASYPVHFSDIKGEAANNDPGTDQYMSTVQIPGSLENKIIGYKGKTKTMWVWESQLLVTDDFEQLKKSYRSYYNDINGNTIANKVSRRFINVMPYEAPNETQRLWSNQFRLNESSASHSNLLIDLVAENIGFEWVIWLRVYDKERDADVRPTENDSDGY